MHMRQHFKNSEETSDSDDIDELADAELEDEEIILGNVRLIEPWSNEDIEEGPEAVYPEYDIESEDTDSDDSSEFDEMADAELEYEEIILGLIEPWSNEDIEEGPEGVDPEYDIESEDTDSDDSSEFDEMA